jgi:hypothetical protein
MTSCGAAPREFWLACAREDPCLARIPVIFTGGQHTARQSRTFAMAPVIAQLAKPFSLHQLLAAIHAAGRRDTQEVLA